MTFPSLKAWLDWQEQLHPSEIDLGLQRVAEVAGRLDLLQPAAVTLTVAGTNGKGSCVSLLAAILRAAGYKVGAYTSPHLLRYNERVQIDGVEASDAEFCSAFEAIDQARGEVSLTYFEFGTLVALELFKRASVDVQILEVGLGGRLDAVNILDADAALLTSVALDHQDWLGSDREVIGFEKAGVFRGGRLAVCADPEPPQSVFKHAAEIGAELLCVGRDYQFGALEAGQWSWSQGDQQWQALPPPALAGRFQLGNAAAVMTLLRGLAERLPVERAAVEMGLRQVALAGRLQRFGDEVETLLDVAHNPAAALVLAAELAENPAAGETTAVVGMFRDKDAAQVVAILADQIDRWLVVPLGSPRALVTEELAALIRRADPAAELSLAESVSAGYEQALASARSGDRLLVFGSFFTVAPVLAQLAN